MVRLLPAVLLFALASPALAQTRQPAQITTLPTTTPQEFDLLDNTGKWFPISAASRPTINVLMYGADPTGANDSTAAINNAIQASQYFGYPTGGNPYRPGPCVHLPAGNYKIHDAVNLDKYGGCFYGDGRVQTYLMVDSSTFNLSAPGVINLQNTGGGTAPEISDLNIYLNQPDTSVRANLPAIPPAIYGNGAGRQMIRRVQIGGGFRTCIDARGNTGGSFFQDIECGALSFGLRLDGAADGVHVNNWHQWNFELVNKTGLNAIYGDGTNDCLELGRVDTIGVSGAQCWLSNIVWTANAANSTDAHFLSNVTLDGGRVIQNAAPPTGIFISGLQCASNNGFSFAATYQCIVAKGGALRISGYRTATNSSSTLPGIEVDAGNVTLINGTVSAGSTTVQAAKVNAGVLSVYNSFVSAPAGMTAPVFEQVGGSLALVDNLMNIAPTGGTPVMAAFDVDNAFNMFAGNALFGWGLTIPATHNLGQYGFIATSDGRLTANKTVNVEALYSNGTIYSTSANPDISWKASGAQPVDQHWWDTTITTANGDLQFRVINDAASTVNAFLTLNRGTGASLTGAKATFAVPITASALPTTAGAGGLYVCIDSTGVMYKKAACP